MIYLIKKWLYRILPTSLYLYAMQKGFIFLYDLGLLKNDSRFKFHYGIKKLIAEDDIVLDIGANLGYFSMLFARLNRKGKLYAIEPIPLFFNRLKNILSKYKHAIPLHTAFGEKAGTLYMVMPVQQGTLRTGLPHVIDPSELANHSNPLEVPVLNASEFLASIERLDYIKCDIEGYEWVVFNSIQPHISRLRPVVQVEISEVNIPLFLSYFEELGYVQTGIYNHKLIEENGKQKETSDFLFIPEERMSALFTKFNA